MLAKKFIMCVKSQQSIIFICSFQKIILDEGNHFNYPGLSCIVLQKLSYRNDPKFSDRYAWANSADPDQTAPRGAV